MFPRIRNSIGLTSIGIVSVGILVAAVIFFEAINSTKYKVLIRVVSFMPACGPGPFMFPDMPDELLQLAPDNLREMMLKREAFMRQSVGWTDKIQYPSFPELVSDEEMVQLLVEANPGYTIRLWRIIEKVGGAFYESRRISEAQTLEIIAKAYHYHFSPLFLFCSGYIS